MQKMNGRQIVSFLKKNKGSYIENGVGKSTLKSSDGDEIAEFSFYVFDNLINSKRIKKISDNSDIWSKGNYALSV